jgi:hypothetical protein
LILLCSQISTEALLAGWCFFPLKFNQRGFQTIKDEQILVIRVPVIETRKRGYRGLDPFPGDFLVAVHDLLIDR